MAIKYKHCSVPWITHKLNTHTNTESWLRYQAHAVQSLLDRYALFGKHSLMLTAGMLTIPVMLK